MAARDVPRNGATADAGCARIAAAQHGVLTRAQASASGIRPRGVRHRIESGRWARVYPGVYRMCGSQQTWHQELMAACLWAGADAVASHRAAAALWELEGFPAGPLEVSCPRDLKAPVPGLIVHKVTGLGSPDLAAVAGIPVTSPSRTLMDLCGPRIAASRKVLGAAVDDALRRGLTSVPRLRWTLDRLGGRGRPGTGLLRELLRERAPGDPPPASELEARLIKLLRTAKLPQPRREHQVKENGTLLARVDLAYPDRLLAIEADGYRFHSGRVAWQRDRRRRNVLTTRGWRVLHVTGEDLALRSSEVIAEIRRALGEPAPGKAQRLGSLHRTGEGAGVGDHV
jgi:very-short-patch-repair endonuclease